jgi:hypothetical protein
MLVQQHGPSAWAAIAASMPGRNPRQCRDRWNHYLSKRMNSPWSPVEDRILLQKIREFGYKWSRIAVFLPDRTEHDVKARWDFVLKKELASLAKARCDSVPNPAIEPSRPLFPSLVIDPTCRTFFPTDLFSPAPIANGHGRANTSFMAMVMWGGECPKG